jgi:hypothetical protein
VAQRHHWNLVRETLVQSKKLYWVSQHFNLVDISSSYTHKRQQGKQ